jgi:nucleoside-diphosphate-sugar epimerase
MRVFVAGATGVLGRRLVRQLVARGHVAVGLARTDEGERTIRSLGGEPRRADLFDADGLTKAAEGCSVVVHVATAIPTKVRTKSKDWAMNDRIRREGTKCLTTAAVRVGAGAYLQQSVVWAVRGLDGRMSDEDAPPVSDPILASSLDGERIAREAGAKHGLRAVVLRCGGFYSADGWHTRILADSLARGRPVLVDRGAAVWSWLHAEDAASAFVAAAEWPKPGVWHVVDDRPASLNEFLGALARKLGTHSPRRVSRSLARLFLGRYTAELLVSSFPTSNARFRSDFRWSPSFPTFERGLDEVVSAWRSEGFPGGRVSPA